MPIGTHRRAHIALGLILSLALALTASAEEPAAKVTLDSNGLNIHSADDAFAMKIGGRIHADANWHGTALDNGFKTTNGTEIRRGRIELAGHVFEDWKWSAQYEFADNKAGIRDLWVGYAGFEDTVIAVGSQKQPYSLSLEMSSNDLPFIERSIDNFLLAPFVDRAIGARVDTNGEHWFVAAGFFGEDVQPGAAGVDEGYGAAGRVIVAPIIEDDRVLHLGFRTAYRTHLTSDGTTTVRLRDETTHLSGLSVVDTGAIGSLQSVTIFGPEAALAIGPFSLTGEYNRAHFNRRSGGSKNFQSGHIAATWSLTGESRAASYRIKSGEFGRLKNKNNFSLRDGTCGAFELALRYAYLDLSDGGFQGGEEQVLSTGLNWYTNKNVRFMFDWSYVIDVDGDSPLPAIASVTTGGTAAGTAADALSMFSLRAELIF